MEKTTPPKSYQPCEAVDMKDTIFRRDTEGKPPVKVYMEASDQLHGKSS